MPDVFTPRKRSEIMSRIRGKDTGMELRIRAALWQRGLRYRVYYGPFKIDIAFPGAKVAVFLDSCYWHGCPAHFKTPRTHTRFWREKITRNRKRDHRVTRALRARGWTVLRLWEHEIDDDLGRIVRRVKESLRLSKGSNEKRK